MSYLYNRMNYIEINGVTDTPFEVMKGVPQGSKLSSILFNLFMNDIFEEINDNSDIKILLYADDIIILCGDKDWNNMKNKLEHNIKKLKEWCEKNDLIINEQKCYFTVFQATKTEEKCENNNYLKINDWVIKYVEVIKYLGIYFDYKLNFGEHVKYIKKNWRNNTYDL